jgi:hypothetical protein
MHGQYPGGSTMKPNITGQRITPQCLVHTNTTGAGFLGLTIGLPSKTILGIVVCSPSVKLFVFLFEMHPNKLTPDLIADYHIRLFCDLFHEQVLGDPKRIVSHPPPPWASTESGKPSTRVKINLATLPPSPLLPENALRSTSRWLTLPSPRAAMSPDLL